MDQMVRNDIACNCIPKGAACIKLPFVIKIFVLSIFEWRFDTGFTVVYFEEKTPAKLIKIGSMQGIFASMLVYSFAVCIYHDVTHCILPFFFFLLCFVLGSKNGCRGRKEEEEGEEEGSRWTLTRKEKETKGIYTEYF